MTIINESGLYSLILSSKLPNAKKFKHWITSEVIPSIRRHGAYMTPHVPGEILFGILRNTRLGGCLAALWSTAQSRFMGLPFLPQPIPQRAYIFYPNDYP